MPVATDEFLTTSQVAEELRSSGDPRWRDIDQLKVQRMIKAGKIKAFRAGWIWIIPREEVNRLLRK